MEPSGSRLWSWGGSMTKNKKPFGPLYQKALKKYARSLGLRGSALAVLNVFADCINGETGQARPGRKHLMEETGIQSDRTLDKALKTLRDTGVIKPIAYLTGGRGRATVYGFCLPAWSGQPRTETTAINAEVQEGSENQNPRRNYQKPPQNMSQTPATNAAPTERTERTEGGSASGTARSDAPSRRDEANVSKEQQREDIRQFSRWVDQYGFGRARELERERDAARMAAE